MTLSKKDLVYIIIPFTLYLILFLFKNEESIEFSTFDILSDEDVRAGLKTFSDWPTYPQLYVKGEFIGGLDIIQEMKEEGSLKDQLEQMLAEAA